MPAPKTAERLRARELRRDGLSVKEIAREVRVSKSTASLWVRDLPVAPGRARRRPDPEVLRVRRGRAMATRNNEKLAVANDIGRLSDRELLLVGAALYWAEGAKDKPWRTTERLLFINSDPGVIRVFCRWLELLGVPTERVSFRVSIHESADVEGAVTFWSAVVGVPAADFRRTSLKRHNPVTRRRNTGATYHGCLQVDVAMSRDYYRRMEGVWWAIAAAGRGPARRAQDLVAAFASLDSTRREPGPSRSSIPGRLIG